MGEKKSERIPLTAFDNIEALREFIREEVQKEVRKLMAEEMRKLQTSIGYRPQNAEYKTNGRVQISPSGSTYSQLDLFPKEE